ncbi:hypothetical protein HDK90DRAFT_204385 [Phyllosticta capitalensis]|uniref:Uncharacterized protein n=1 Tax=Phyllosticta capitalensis TaxID=121624 RepID=A0ABR1YSH3_9PEZI
MVNAGRRKHLPVRLRWRGCVRQINQPASQPLAPRARTHALQTCLCIYLLACCDDASPYLPSSGLWDQTYRRNRNDRAAVVCGFETAFVFFPFFSSPTGLCIANLPFLGRNCLSLSVCLSVSSSVYAYTSQLAHTCCAWSRAETRRRDVTRATRKRNLSARGFGRSFARCLSRCVF